MPDRMWRYALAALGLAGAIVAGSFGAGAAQPVVTTADGAITGTTTDSGVDAFLGIPYAAPPVGPLRWKPPQAPAAWSAPRDASAFGNACPQSTVIGAFAGPSSTEDCLYLNVFVPPGSTARGGRRPVMVWIPGGGFYAGESNDYDPAALVKTGDAVVVTINYRIGVLGFFAHPALDKEAHALGDYGLMDQQFALAWVQRNIARFGGDPHDVTIFGESAGGISVLAHLASPGSAHLFARAIVESGGTVALKPTLTPLAAAEQTGTRFATAAGCTNNDLACLRALPVAQILAVQQPLLQGLIGDTATLPGTFRDAFESGKFNRVPLLIGNNRDEWRWPIARTEINSGKQLTADQYPAALAAFYGVQNALRVQVEYPIAGYHSPSEALGAAETDSYMACSSWKLDNWLSAYIPVYAYQFNDRNAPMYMVPVSFPYGAAYTIELQFVFPGFHGGPAGAKHPLNAAETALAAQMAGYWTSFARTGDPNGGALAAWPKYAPSTDAELSLQTGGPVPFGTFVPQHHCAFWDTISAY